MEIIGLSDSHGSASSAVTSRSSNKPDLSLNGGLVSAGPDTSESGLNLNGNDGAEDGGRKTDGGDQNLPEDLW